MYVKALLIPFLESKGILEFMRLSSQTTDSSSRASSRWGSLKSSTQMFLVALIVQVIATVLSLIAVYGSLSSPSGTLTLFLVCLVGSIIASALVMILTVVGLFRYRHMTLWNALLLIFTVVTNPVVVLALLATAL